MANIVIEDLEMNEELDKILRQKIFGGCPVRRSSRPTTFIGSTFGPTIHLGVVGPWLHTPPNCLGKRSMVPS
jgi:hypothetical protein